MQDAISRRSFFLKTGLGTLAAAQATRVSPWGAQAAPPTKKSPTAQDTFALLKLGKRVPVIFDTDIGGDIDDTWALAMLLKSPELDVKLVVSDAGNTEYRARVIAKMLEVFGRTDIPIGVGAAKGNQPAQQSDWIEGYELSQYPGKVHEDGVGAIVDTINASADPVTLICVGAVPNIALALDGDPGIARRARFVGMHGSVRKGYGNSDTLSREANVVNDPKALQKVFAAPWDVTITPLDTCGIVQLKGHKYQRVYQCKDPRARAIIDNYRVWLPNASWIKDRDTLAVQSTTLFDTVAVYLAYSQELLGIEQLRISVTDDGYTVIDPQARKINCAMSWTSLGAFEDHLVGRLTSK